MPGPLVGLAARKAASEKRKKAATVSETGIRSEFNKVATPGEKRVNARRGGDKYMQSVLDKYKSNQPVQPKKETPVSAVSKPKKAVVKKQILSKAMPAEVKAMPAKVKAKEFKTVDMAKAEVIQPKAEGLINLNSPARKTVQEVAKPVEAKTKSKSRFGRRAPKGSFKATMRRY